MFKEKLQPFIDRYEEINTLLSSPEIASDVKKMTELGKEQAKLSKLVEKANEYIETADAIEENKELLGDPELGELAKEELSELEPKLPELEDEIKVLMIPSDPNDDKNIILELRAGAGGDEAALFVADVFKMYLRHAEIVGWKVEIISSSDGTAGGYKEMVAQINGEGVYSQLKFEAGTHRVQRVPDTETQGRVHTSAITVAVIPEVDDVEVELKPNDIKMDVYRSSGCGGQSVNTTDSAVRLTHIPTGIVAAIQDEKSQHKNRDKAMKVLKARVYEAQLQAQLDETSAQRKLQVGSGSRSEKIRTYNYPQNRLTDHRIDLTLYSLDRIMNDGNLKLVLDPLNTHAQAEAIKEAGL
ncbi:MAG TPA: peptide chain release factor 1 [Campylobacterales bacterium]|nr:peptide chain release factor 1 [Campylobacterales bacterium]HHS93346.1 peptide chain release factor 1 [Campylobacterales bacterium]